MAYQLNRTKDYFLNKCKGKSVDVDVTSLNVTECDRLLTVSAVNKGNTAWIFLLAASLTLHANWIPCLRLDMTLS